MQYLEHTRGVLFNCNYAFHTLILYLLRGIYYILDETKKLRSFDLSSFCLCVIKNKKNTYVVFLKNILPLLY